MKCALQGSTNLDAIQIIKKTGGTLRVRAGHAVHAVVCMLCMLRCAGLCYAARGTRGAAWASAPSAAGRGSSLVAYNLCCRVRCGLHRGGVPIHRTASPPSLYPLLSLSSPTSSPDSPPILPGPQDSYLDEGFILDKRIGVGQVGAAGARPTWGVSPCRA